MSLALTLCLVWMLVANVLALIPSRDNYWTRAYGLIATGIPLLGYATWQSGPLVGLLVFAAGASVLRWPLIYLWRWARRQVAR